MAISANTIEELEQVLSKQCRQQGWDHFAIARELNAPQPFLVEFRGNQCPLVVIRTSAKSGPPSSYVMGTP